MKILFPFLILTAALSGCGHVEALRLPAVTAEESPSDLPPDLKVAILGDSSIQDTAREVLRLIRREGASLVIHSGDLDYEDDPDAWDRMITEELGADFPYFVSIGNHDESRWAGPGGYAEHLAARWRRVSDAVCSGEVGVNTSCYYKGLRILLSGVGTAGRDHERFLEAELAASHATWKICSWHKNQRLMQCGGKRDEVGWRAYEICREAGAIIATGHEHSYCRTHLLSNMQQRTVVSTSSTLELKPGQSFVIQSGLGGHSIRVAHSPSQGAWWASVYTANQRAKFGALFCSFRAGGDPKKAACYFKNVAGAVVDRFELRQ